MEVITQNRRVVVLGPQDKDLMDIYLPLDGKSNKDEVAAFQDWLVVEKGLSVKVDGIYGSETKKYWRKYKKEYEKSGPVKTNSKIKTGSSKSEPSEEEKKEKAKKGQGWDKAKKAWVSIKDTAEKYGVIDALLNKIGLGPASPQTDYPSVTTEDEKKQDEPKKMSTTTMVLIGVGALALVGTIIYVSNKKK